MAPCFTRAHVGSFNGTDLHSIDALSFGRTLIVRGNMDEALQHHPHTLLIVDGTMLPSGGVHEIKHLMAVLLLSSDNKYEQEPVVAGGDLKHSLAPPVQDVRRQEKARGSDN